MTKPNLNIAATGTRGFLQYLKVAQPRVYAGVAEQLRRGGVRMSGLGDEPSVYDTSLMTFNVATPTLSIANDPAATASTSSMSSGIADVFKGLVQTVSTAYLTKNQLDAQNKLMNIQLQRAQQGLPPLNIDPATYGLQPTVGVGLSPATQQLVMWGWIGLLGFLFLNSAMKHSRR